MIQRNLQIGRWWVEFYFCPDGYDIDYLCDRLFTAGIPIAKMKRAYNIMVQGLPNRGFTCSNPVEKFAIVVVGPTTSGAEFLDSLVHEVHHLAVAVASELGVSLRGEGPAYLSGDSARDLADVICALGCDRCSTRG